MWPDPRKLGSDGQVTLNKMPGATLVVVRTISRSLDRLKKRLVRLWMGYRLRIWAEKWPSEVF
jgi:hypothetical protein